MVGGKVGGRSGADRTATAAANEAVVESTRLRMPRSSVFGTVIDATDYLQLAAAADYHDEASPSPLRKVKNAYIPYLIYTID